MYPLIPALVMAILIGACASEGKKSSPSRDNRDFDAVASQVDSARLDPGDDIKVCREKPEYNPETIRCEVSFLSASDWRTNKDWQPALSEYVKNGADPNVNWIGARDNCERNQTKHSLYVTHLKIKSTQSYSFHMLSDAAGSFTLIRDGKVLLNRETATRKANQLKFEMAEGTYQVVVAAKNSGERSAIAMNVRDESGKTIRNSTHDGDWCVFQLPAGQNSLEYLANSGICYECYNGILTRK